MHCREWYSINEMVPSIRKSYKLILVRSINFKKIQKLIQYVWSKTITTKNGNT